MLSTVAPNWSLLVLITCGSACLQPNRQTGDICYWRRNVWFVWKRNTSRRSFVVMSDMTHQLDIRLDKSLSESDEQILLSSLLFVNWIFSLFRQIDSINEPISSLFLLLARLIDPLTTFSSDVSPLEKTDIWCFSETKKALAGDNSAQIIRRFFLTRVSYRSTTTTTTVYTSSPISKDGYLERHGNSFVAYWTIEDGFSRHVIRRGTRCIDAHYASQRSLHIEIQARDHQESQRSCLWNDETIRLWTTRSAMSMPCLLCIRSF